MIYKKKSYIFLLGYKSFSVIDADRKFIERVKLLILFIITYLKVLKGINNKIKNTFLKV
jgi:hypothetical protein